MYNLMVDIETLDTKPTAVVLSIAVVAFDPLTGDSKTLMHMFPNVEQQTSEGRTISGATAQWWMTQPLPAQRAMLVGRHRDLGIPVNEIRAILKGHISEANAIWANGPDFDCVILANFLGDDFKWPFSRNRCVRTMKNLFAEHVAHIEHIGVSHDAESDCLYQIQQIAAIYSKVESLRI